MSAAHPAFAPLREHGLLGGAGVVGTLEYERPAYIYGHRLKDCSIGAFTYLNTAGNTSAYRCRLGRYVQVAESVIIGPPEHPLDGFSTHPFAFTRPKYMPNLYSLPDFARLAPDEQSGPSYVDTVPSDTHIGHEVYLCAGALIKRGVSIGDGAVIGAGSIVTRDVPAYAVAVGAPARVTRLRFAENLVERFLKLQWWRYDLAPFKNAVDFSQAEATLAFFEERAADGSLMLLQPDSYRVSVRAGAPAVERLAAPLYFPT
ncbi:CatB-related O-acetyltransferase [Solimonas soli]|uniref:CatB-related O-acetyltransferase n=1 Tax=Solimonas soli TaxID=413479 RepID=UPI0004B26DB7|nr:CatB-related O-acetyltransferase [Solimonas soli]